MATKARYRHTQIGWVILGAMGAAAAVIVPSFVAAGLTTGLWVFFAILALVVPLFATLTVTVDERYLKLSFGCGVIRKRFVLTEIRSFRKVDNRWYYGWGIRYFPGGVLYNVSGLQAVEILMDSGRYWRIGTDEPGALLQALEQAIGEPEPVSSTALARERQSSRRWVVSGAILILVVVAVVAGLFIAQSRAPRVTVDAEGFTVESLFYGDRYPLSDVTSISLEHHLPPILARTNGFAAGGVLRGWFRLQGMGPGKLFVEHSHPPYVIARLQSGFVIVNYTDPKRTEALFVELMRARAGVGKAR